MTDFLRRYVLKNAGLKLVSLVIAVLMWAAVARDPIAETAISVPIEFHHVPENLEISSEALPQASIRLRGPSRLLREMSSSELHAILDLSNAHPGETTYELTSRQIRAPHGVDVVQVIPSMFRINFDNRAEKLVPVRPRVIGTFAQGIRMGHVAADPATVKIIGPAQRVNAIDAAITDPVNATGVVDQATFTTHVYVPDPLVRLTQAAPVHVTVMVVKSR